MRPATVNVTTSRGCSGSTAGGAGYTIVAAGASAAGIGGAGVVTSAGSGSRGAGGGASSGWATRVAMPNSPIARSPSVSSRTRGDVRSA